MRNLEILIMAAVLVFRHLLQHKVIKIHTLVSKIFISKKYIIKSHIQLHTIREEIKRILPAHSK